MPWKMDGENLVLEKGSPVWIDGEGSSRVIEDMSPHFAELAKAKGDLASANAESRDRRLKIKELETRLGAFGELDPEEAGGLAAKQRAAQEEGRQLRAELDKYQDQVRTLMVRSQIASSRFLTQQTVLPPDIAEAAFGHHFTVEELDGRPTAVARVGGEVITTRDPQRAGQPASVDEALSIIINEHYANKDRILRAPDNAGGGGGNPAAGPEPAEDLAAQHRRAVSSGDPLRAVALKNLAFRAQGV